MTVAFRAKNTHDSDIRDFCQQVERVTLLQGRELTVDLAATTSAQEFDHGLDGPYSGAFVVAQSHTAAIFIALPSSATDPRRRIRLQQSAATAGSAKLWVY